jgi:hypothetical protein
VTDYQPAAPMTLDQVRNRIIAIVEGEKRREAVQKVLLSLRDKAKIELFVSK